MGATRRVLLYIMLKMDPPDTSIITQPNVHTSVTYAQGIQSQTSPDRTQAPTFRGKVLSVQEVIRALLSLRNLQSALQGTVLQALQSSDGHSERQYMKAGQDSQLHRVDNFSCEPYLMAIIIQPNVQSRRLVNKRFNSGPFKPGYIVLFTKSDRV